MPITTKIKIKNEEMFGFVQSLGMFYPFDQAGIAIFAIRIDLRLKLRWLNLMQFQLHYDESIEAVNLNRSVNFLRLQFLFLNEMSKPLKN